MDAQGFANPGDRPSDSPGDREPDMPSLTYAELAEALKITPASANKLARRRRWPRLMGNDGRARVSVPDEALVRQDSPQDMPPDVPPVRPRTKMGHLSMF